MSTKISWTDETWNPIIGCSKISEGCANCYAEKMAARLANMDKPGYCDGIVELNEERDLFIPKWTGVTILRLGTLEQPLHWKKPRNIFICSMGDLFHENISLENILNVLAIILLCPQHKFLILTKRPQIMAEVMKNIINDSNKNRYLNEEEFIMSHLRIDVEQKYLRAANNYWKFKYNQIGRGICDSPVPYPYPNLYLGVSVENQKAADERIPILLQIPAAKRFISIEPCLGDINLEQVVQRCAGEKGCEYVGVAKIFNNPRKIGGICCPNCGKNHTFVCDLMLGKISQIIIGCESGQKRRPCKIEWVRSIVQQCQAAGVKVFVKQLDINGRVSHDMNEWPEDLRIQEKL